MKIEIFTEMGMRYIKIPFYKENAENEQTAAVLPEYEYNILETAEIPGLAGVTKKIVDGETYLSFPIYTYISLEERFYKESLNIDLFCDFFKQLLQVYENMRAYLLEGNSLCLNPEYIFFDEQEKRYVFLPTVNFETEVSKKFENLFTFFADLCPLEEKDLLGFIFENFGALAEDNFEPVSFMKYVVGYKFNIKQPDDSDQNEKSFCYEYFDDEDEEVTSEKSKVSGVFVVCMIFLIMAFFFSYLVDYEFKYSIVSIAAVFLAIGLIAFQVLKVTKILPKRKNV